MASAKKSKTGKRYTHAQKEKLLAEYQAMRDSGTTSEDAAKALHVTYATLNSWEKEAGASKKFSISEFKPMPAIVSPDEYFKDTEIHKFVKVRWRGHTFEGSMEELEEYIDFLRGVLGEDAQHL